ncbi:OmpA family protein [Fontimonas sp. SYSU GA230001]|uniref:OmpA family protein n=1 Tax=Fontimonas sp. SYSU GA230001 TaxID=3142450 RepID=UPI0032B46BC5
MRPKYVFGGWGLFALLLTLGFGQPVLAQDDDADAGDADAPGLFSTQALTGRHYYVSPMFSYTRADKDRGTDDGMGGMITIGKKMTDGLALELTGYYSQMDPDSGSGDAAELKGAGLGAMVFLSNKVPNFYGLLALMYGRTDTHPGPIPNFKSTVFDVGAGYLFPFNRYIALRAEARYRTDQHDRKQAGVGKENGAFQDALFNVGLLLPLGVTPVEAPVAEPEPVEQADLDSDGDGVPDSQDQCPNTLPGVQVNEVGCPLDADGDGVLDADDECPNTPAGAKVLANGCALVDDCRKPRPGEQVDENGCAAERKFILRGVKFEFDSDRLTPEAREILNEVAGTLRAYPDVDVELQGHTDSIGTDAYNQSLSERRAIAVKAYLVEHEVEAKRMSPVGYGESQPIATNDTEEGREENRRVELKVIE